MITTINEYKNTKSMNENLDQMYIPTTSAMSKEYINEILYSVLDLDANSMDDETYISEYLDFNDEEYQRFADVIHSAQMFMLEGKLQDPMSELVNLIKTNKEFDLGLDQDTFGQ